MKSSETIKVAKKAGQICFQFNRIRGMKIIILDSKIHIFIA